ncbi:MAG: hypothetical protein EA366_01275, partial [Spirulina sp. DLM2.Bin59]
EYLQHILDETTYITANSVDLNKTEFLQNETVNCPTHKGMGLSRQFFYKNLPFDRKSDRPPPC